MRSDWPVSTVEQMQNAGILLVEDGNHGEYRPRSEEFGHGATAFIRAADLVDGRVLFETVERISDSALERIRKGIGRGGDVLLSHKGTVGKLALVPLDAPPFVCSPQTTFWRTLDASRLDRRFLYHFMSSWWFAEQLQTRKGETDMADYVSLTTQRTFRVPIPPIVEQHAIAGVLSALDDRITLTHEINRTLQTLAATLFRSWFVDFDPVVARSEGRKPVGVKAEIAGLFPASFSEGDGDSLPAGWRAGVLGDIAENPRRAADPAQLAPDTPYIGLEHMPRRSIALNTWGAASDVASAKTSFRRGEVLFGKLRPYFHKVGVAPVAGVCSTDILVIVPKNHVWFGLLLGHVSSVEFINHADGSSVGTKMPRARWRDLAQYGIVLPPLPVAAAFSDLVVPLIEKIASNVHESRTLMTLRDSLLPGLFSGEIRVGRAEQLVQPAL